MSVVMISTMVLCFALTISVAVSIGLASILGIQASNAHMLISVKEMFGAINKFPLAAIPFFILAGNLMESGGISRRLVEFAKSLVGGVQGGLPMTCVLTCMIFAAVSGSSVATTFAIGAILVPALVKHGYPVTYAASLQATAAELGVVIPPSIPLILYGVSAEVSIGELFIAGFGPGVLIAGALMLFVWLYCKWKGWGKNDGDGRMPMGRATLQASWALFMPVIILGGIYGGVFTPTEAAAVAAVYAFAIAVFVYRDIGMGRVPGVLVEAGKVTVMLMFIVANALLFAHVLTTERIPQQIAEMIIGWGMTGWQFLIVVNILLLIAGMFMEPTGIILILAPILFPIAMRLGIDPVHLGIIMVVNLEIGMVTPPIGLNLFVTAGITRMSIGEVVRAALPWSLVLLAFLVIITYVPAITLFLPNLLF